MTENRSEYAVRIDLRLSIAEENLAECNRLSGRITELMAQVKATRWWRDRRRAQLLREWDGCRGEIRALLAQNLRLRRASDADLAAWQQETGA